MVKKQLTQEICERKFGREKGALISVTVYANLLKLAHQSCLDSVGPPLLVLNVAIFKTRGMFKPIQPNLVKNTRSGHTGVNMPHA